MSKSLILTSTRNGLVKRLISLRTHPTSQTVLITGKKMVTELCSKIQATTLLVEQHCSLPSEILKPKHFYKASERVVQRVSGLQSTDGFVAEIEVPSQVDLEEVNGKSIVVFDQLSDPGNLGTLLRCAVGFRFECAYFISCVHVWNDKCVRAARGAHWEIPLSIGSWRELGEVVRKRNLVCFVAKSSPQGIMVDQVKQIKETIGKFNGYVLVVGNESRGVQEEELKKWVPEKNICFVHIPIDKIESLNVSVAGGILMYTLQNCSKM